MIFVAMDTILAGHYVFLSYLNVSIYEMVWCSVNTIAKVLNHILLERAGHQHSNKVCVVCITILGIEV